MDEQEPNTTYLEQSLCHHCNVTMHEVSAEAEEEWLELLASHPGSVLGAADFTPGCYRLSSPIFLYSLVVFTSPRLL